MWTVAAVGVVVYAVSAYHLPINRLDLRFLLLALITIAIGSRIAVEIPRVSGRITVADTFIFLTMLLYGGEAAVLLAAAEGTCSSLRISRKPRTILFNAAVMACATYLTVNVLHYSFGTILALPYGEYSANFVIALCVMALVQYIVNSGLIAIAQSYKINRTLRHTWSKYYLWTSLTYFAGASGAGIIAKLMAAIGFHALIVTTPIIAIVYLTYRTYLKNVQSSLAHAEQAERHIEELSRYIAEQERIREQFSQIEKLSALGELASGVAHDFNNTLASVLGRTELLLRTDDMEKITRGLQIIRKSTQDGAKTVRRIQDFARQRRDHDFMRVSVDQVLLDVSEITLPRWKTRAEASSVHISLDLQACSKAEVLGDPSELREVLVNMIFNAVDAMPQGGKLTLSTAEVDGAVEIRVSDTGTGMSPEVRSRIFDPFFTTKGKAGLGLGLAVSYGIIRRHEGTFEVESEPGRGTTFRIRLPLRKAAKSRMEYEVAVPVASAPVFALPRSQRTSILVVDDEAPVRELLRDILESEGHEVVIAEGGREALALFDQGNFDAVFTDVGMPEMSGWQLARALRERDERIPLAVITGWGEAVGANQQGAAQVDWVVTKPFTVARIAELARGVSQRRNEARRTAATSARPLLAPARSLTLAMAAGASPRR